MAAKIVFSPALPSSVMDIARGMLPAGYELQVIDQSDPEFPNAVQDAEYFVGTRRVNCKLKSRRSDLMFRCSKQTSTDHDKGSFNV